MLFSERCSWWWWSCSSGSWRHGLGARWSVLAACPAQKVTHVASGRPAFRGGTIVDLGGTLQLLHIRVLRVQDRSHPPLLAMRETIEISWLVCLGCGSWPCVSVDAAGHLGSVLARCIHMPTPACMLKRNRCAGWFVSHENAVLHAQT